MDLVFTHGKMGDNMWDIGKMENNMEKVPIKWQLDKKRKECGKMGKESNG